MSGGLTEYTIDTVNQGQVLVMSQWSHKILVPLPVSSLAHASLVALHRRLHRLVAHRGYCEDLQVEAVFPRRLLVVLLVEHKVR